MDFMSAKNAFKSILQSLNDVDRVQFLSWCEENYSDSCVSKSYFDLRTIAEDIKSLIPVEAILPSERVDHSKLNGNFGDSVSVIHVDSFLYEDEHIDALVDEGKLKRNYCQDCKSVKISPITFISHSASIPRIEFIFQNMLPDLTGKVVLDVGSRLGAMLYGAYYCSSARKIIGVEMNDDLCKLQKHIIDKYDLKDRIEVICNDICNVPEVIHTANVILFNNVFQCFMPLEMQHKLWIQLRNIITVPGTIVVTAPSIEDTLRNLNTGIDILSWLRQVPVENAKKMDDPDLIGETCCYVVL